MASMYVNTGEEGMGQPRSPAKSPRDLRELKRSWSSNSSAACGHGTAAGPKCVCAPPTHAGSFKCRLHRANSQAGHSSAPATPSPTVAAASSASAWTVEAQ